MQRPRLYWEKNVQTGVITTQDLTTARSLAEDKAESIAEVREMARAKIRAVHPSLDDPERLTLGMLRFMFLIDKRAIGSLTVGETTWMNAVRTLLARIWAIRQAADDIEAEIAALQTNAAVFDHNAGLATNPLWPE